MSSSTATTAPKKVRASHVLIKHKQSRNPFSRRTLEEITISREDAIKEMEELLSSGKLNPDTFASVAKERSDCSSYKNGGDLGPFGKGLL